MSYRNYRRRVYVSTCKCIDELNELLKEKNTRLVVSVSSKTGAEKVAVYTERVEHRGGRVTVVVANYCPFCGVKYPEPTG